MAPVIDLAVVGQDPWLGGGVRAQAVAFWDAARALGRDPRYVYLSRTRAVSLLRRSLVREPTRDLEPPFEGVGLPSFLPELDAPSQLLGARSVARAVAGSGSLWVVSTTASYGYGATLSGKQYGCWIGTALADEWAGRRRGLRLSRRLALRANAPLLLQLERSVLRRAAVVCATSPWSRRALAEAGGLDDERVRILPIPVDAERFSPQPDEEWLARLEEPVLAFAGRGDDPRKNLPLLLDAFRLVQARLPRARLRLIGRPPPPGAPLPPGVEVLGEVESVAAHLRSSSLFVLPSWQEGFAIVAAEALAAGVPVVATPSGGPEHLIRESGGGHVLSTFSADELATTVLELLARPDALAEMRRRGRDHVLAEHSPEHFRARLAAAFAELDADG